MHNGFFIQRQAASWFLCIAFTCMLNHCNGQNYFFEEIKLINSSNDGEQNITAGQNYTDGDDPFISFENATLLQDDEPQESLLEKIKFPEFYHAQGIISLPYDGIIEPFEAWYAGRHKMSRIDYYYGNH